MKELPKKIKYVAVKNGEARNIYSIEEAFSYQNLGFVILKWNPLLFEKKIIES